MSTTKKIDVSHICDELEKRLNRISGGSQIIALRDLLHDTKADRKLFVTNMTKFKTDVQLIMQTTHGGQQVVLDMVNIIDEILASNAKDKDDKDAAKKSESIASKLAEEEADAKLAEEEADAKADAVKQLAEDEATKLAEEAATKLAEDTATAKKLAEDTATKLADEEAAKLAEEEAAKLAEEEAAAEKADAAEQTGTAAKKAPAKKAPAKKTPKA